MNRCYYDHVLEQIRSQRLDNNIFFGPINSLIQKDFLEAENIRFFITLELDARQLAQLWEDGLLNSKESVVASFDPNFNCNKIDIGTKFFYENEENLREIVNYVMSSDNDSSGQLGLKQLINSDMANLGTIYGGNWGDQIRHLLNIALVFKMASHYGKILIVSKNGNDNVLVSFLMAIQMIQNPQVSTSEAFNFIKVQRPSVHELGPEFIDLCDSLNDRSLTGSIPDKPSRRFEQMDYLISKRSRIGD